LLDPIEILPVGAAGSNAGAAPTVNGTASNVSESPNSGAEGRAASQETAAMDGVLRSAEEILGSANRLIEVYADRMRASWRRKVARIALASSAALVGIVCLCAATLASFRGICGGFTELLGDRAWAGDLVGGLLALLLVATGVALFHRRTSRKELVRLRAKYARSRDEPR
jgi:hypothetical protein